MELEYRTPSARSLNSLLHELQSTYIFIIYTPATSAIKPSKWLMSIIKFRGYANEKGNSVRSVSLISCICLIQAIDIEDAVYI